MFSISSEVSLLHATLCTALAHRAESLRGTAFRAAEVVVNVPQCVDSSGETRVQQILTSRSPITPWQTESTTMAVDGKGDTAQDEQHQPVVQAEKVRVMHIATKPGYVSLATLPKRRGSYPACGLAPALYRGRLKY